MCIFIRAIGGLVSRLHLRNMQLRRTSISTESFCLALPRKHFWCAAWRSRRCSTDAGMLLRKRSWCAVHEGLDGADSQLNPVMSDWVRA